MPNHYHLVLQNNNGKMSAFQKDTNGQYGSFHRKATWGIGYVFQGRYKSTFVEKDKYLLTAIRYILQNPKRANLVESAKDYPWTSLVEMEKPANEPIIDREFFSELFSDMKTFISNLDVNLAEDLAITANRFGIFLGTKEFVESAIFKFDRRTKLHPTKMGRIDDGWFYPAE